MLVYVTDERTCNMSVIDKMKKSMLNVENMNFVELREKFHELYGDIPHPVNNRTMKKRIIYRIQEMYLGGLSEIDRNLLLQLVPSKKIPIAPTMVSVPKITPGVHYVREWKGKNYNVVVISDKCFEFEGRRYKSLSAVAREITGTRWNGKIFFGVKKQ